MFTMHVPISGRNIFVEHLYASTYMKLTILYFRVAADSARLGRTLLHARRDAGRAADSVQASRAAMIGKDKYSSCDFMCTEYIFMSTIFP